MTGPKDILLCKNNKENCQPESNLNKCKVGLLGPLCETCDLFGKEAYFRKALSFNCEKCTEMFSFKNILFLLLTLGT